MPLGALPEQAEDWVKTVDEMATEDAEVVEYVRSLEERATEVDLSQANGDQIAREFERYLRRRGSSGGSALLGERTVGPVPPRRGPAERRAPGLVVPGIAESPLRAARTPHDRTVLVEGSGSRETAASADVASASKSRSCMFSAKRSVIPET